MPFQASSRKWMITHLRRGGFAFWIASAIILASQSVYAQPDSVDYKVWAHEALKSSLRGFNLRAVELRGSDTASDHLYHYKLNRSGDRVFLHGDHSLELKNEVPIARSATPAAAIQRGAARNASMRIPRSFADSLEIELDTLGHKLSQTEWRDGKLESILRWKYGASGRLLKFWHAFARDKWYPEEEYHYDGSGNLLRADLRGADGSFCGNHIFHRKDREVIEYDTSYVGGHGILTAVQLTAFDSLGRVERYVVKTFGLDGEARQPFGIFSVYHDTIGRYSCEQYSYEADEWAQSSWRTIRYDSAKHEEIRIARETGSALLSTDNRYLPDERVVASKIVSGEPGGTQRPLHDLSCDYTHRGALELSDQTDYPKSTRQVLRFMYHYSAMGP